MSNITVGAVSNVSIREYVEKLRRGEPRYREKVLRSLDWRGQDLQGCCQFQK